MSTAAPDVNAEQLPVNSPEDLVNAPPRLRRVAESLRQEIQEARAAAQWSREEAGRLQDSARRFEEEVAALDAAYVTLLARAAARPFGSPAPAGEGPELLEVVERPALQDVRGVPLELPQALAKLAAETSQSAEEPSAEAEEQEAAPEALVLTEESATPGFSSPTIVREEPETPAQSPAVGNSPEIPDGSLPVVELPLSGKARRAANLERAAEKVPCELCGRLTARHALPRHTGSKPCIEAQAAAGAAPAETPAPEPEPARRHPANPRVLVTRDNYRVHLRRLRDRSPSRNGLAEQLGVTLERLGDLITGDEMPDDEDVLTLEFVLDQSA